MLTAAQRTFTACSLALLAIRVVWLPTTAVALSSSSSFSQGRMTNPNSAVVEALDVAIIGGGPSGLATALALMRGAPTACRNLAVFEADTFTPKGASIVVSKPGWRALRCIDKAVYRKAKRDGAPVAAFYFKDFSGQNRLPRIARFFIGSLLYPVLRLLRTGLVRANGWHAVREILRQGCLDARRDLGFDSDHDNNCAPSLIRSNMTLTDVRTAKTTTKNDWCSSPFKTGPKSELPLCWPVTERFPRSGLPHTWTNRHVRAIFPAGQSVPGTAVSIILPSVSGRATSVEYGRCATPHTGHSCQLGVSIHWIPNSSMSWMTWNTCWNTNKRHVRDFDADQCSSTHCVGR